MPDAKAIEFHCPECLFRLTVARDDQASVRPIGKTGPQALLVRVTCPSCGREILRTVREPGGK